MEGDDRIRQAKMDREKELELAVQKRDEIIQQLSVQLQNLTVQNYSTEATQLAQQVQLLQSQLQHAGKVLQSQTEKQALSSQALQDATEEIVTLRQSITTKDTIMNQLAEKLDVISQEYTKLKESHEVAKMREKETNEVVQKLMMDAEQMRKQKSDVSNGLSTPTSPTPVVSPGMVPEAEMEARMESLRSQLEETYGLHFAEMKQEVFLQYQKEKENLNSELQMVKVSLENSQKQNELYLNQLQDFGNVETKVAALQDECNSYRSQMDRLVESLQLSQKQNEIYEQKLTENENLHAEVCQLHDECNLYKTQNDELKNKINSQQDSIVDLQAELDNLTSENIRFREQMNLLSQDLDAQNSEIEEAFLEKSKYIEKTKLLEAELESVKSENEAYKFDLSKMEDTVSLLKAELEETKLLQQNKMIPLPSQIVKEVGVTQDHTSDTVDEIVLEADIIQESVSPTASTPFSVLDSAEQKRSQIANEDKFNQPIALSEGQSAMCVQEEICFETATLAQSVQDGQHPFKDNSVSEVSTTSTQDMSANPSDDSEATLTNESHNATISDDSNSVLLLNKQLASEIETLKVDLANALEERKFAQSEIEKLCDEIMVLKEHENKTEIELRELQFIKSENEIFQKEKEEHIENSLNLMADIQSAHLTIESLENEKESLSNELQSSLQEIVQLVAFRKSLEEENNELNQKFGIISDHNEKLLAELVSLRQNSANSEASSDSSLVPNNLIRDFQHPQLMENESSQSGHQGSGQSFHVDSENVSQLPSCQTSVNQSQLSQLDNNHMSQFDPSFFYGRQEEVPMQAQEQMSDLSDTTNVSSVQDRNKSVERKPNQSDYYKERKEQLDQEILEMQTHVDDLHSMRANLLEQIEKLKREYKALEKAKKQHQQDSETLSNDKDLKVNDSPGTSEGLDSVVCELREKNETLTDKNDALCRKVTALEWQIRELQLGKFPLDQEPPVEEVMFQNFMDVEDTVDTGTPGSNTQPETQKRNVSENSSEESMKQNVVNKISAEQASEQLMPNSERLETLSQMSPDSIDQGDNEQLMSDISSDSIEPGVSGQEAKHLAMVRNSQCMLSVTPGSFVDIPSSTGGAGGPLLENEKPLSVDSVVNSPIVCTVDGSIDSGSLSDHSDEGSGNRKTNCESCSGNFGEFKCKSNKYSGSEISHDSVFPDDISKTSPIEDTCIDDNVGNTGALNNANPPTATSGSFLPQQHSDGMEISNNTLPDKCETCDSMRTENKKLSTEHKDYEHKLSSIQTELDSLQEKIEVLQTENLALITQCDSLENIKTQVEKELSRLEIHISELEGKCKIERGSMEKVENGLRLTLEELQKEKLVILSETSEKVAAMEQLCSILRNEKEELQNKLLGQERESLLGKYRELQLENENLQEELESKEKEKEKLAQLLEENKAKFIKNKAKLVRLEKSSSGKKSEDVQQLENMLKSKEDEKHELREKMENNIVKLVNDNKTQKETIDLMVNQLRSEKEESDKMQKVVKGITDANMELSDQVKVVSADLESLKTEKELVEQKFMSSVQILEKELASREKDCEYLREILEKEKTHSVHFKDQCAELQDALEKSLKEQKIIEDKCSALENSKTWMESHCQNMAETVDNERLNKSHLEEQCIDLKESIDKIEREREIAEDKCSLLEGQLATSKEEYQNLTVSLITSKSDISLLEDQCSQLKKTFEKLEEEKRSYEEKCTLLGNMLASVEKECCDLRSKLESEISVVANLEKEYKELKESSGSLEKEKQLLMEENSELVKSSEQQQKEITLCLDSERSEIMLLKEQIGDLKQCLEKVENERNISEEKNSLLEEEVLSCEKELKEIKENSDKQKLNVSSLEEQSAVLQQSLAEARTKYEDLNLNFQNLSESSQKEKVSFDSEIKSLKILIAQEREQYSEREVEVAKMFEEVHSELEAKRIMGRNAEELQLKYHQLESILESLDTNADRERETSEMELNIMKQTMDEMKIDLEGRLEQERTTYQNERSELVSKCEKLQDSLSSVEQKLDSLNMEFQTKLQELCAEKNELETKLRNKILEIEESFDLERKSISSDRNSILGKCELLEMEKEKTMHMFEEERNLLISENQTLKERYDRLSMEKEGFVSDHKQLVLQLKDKLEQISLECEKQKTEFRNLESQMENLKQDFSVKVETLEAEKKEINNSYEYKLDSALKDRLRMEQDYNELHCQLDEAKSCESELLEWKGKCSELQTTVTQITIKNDEDDKQLTLQREKIECLQEKCEDLVTNVESVGQERDSWKTECDIIASKLTLLEEESSDLQNHVKELNDRIREISKNHWDEMEMMDKKCEQLGRELEIRQEEFKTVHEDLLSSDAKCQQLEEQTMDTNKKFQISQKELESALKEKEGFHSELKSCEQNFEELKKELETANWQIEESNRKSSEIEGNIENFQEEIMLVKQSRDFYEKELALAKESLQQSAVIHENMNQEIATLKSEVDTLTFNKTELLNQVESLKSKMNENSAMIDSLMEKLRSLTSERDTEQGKNKEILTELKLRNERCEKLILAREQLLQELDASEQLRVQTHNEMDNYKKNLNTLEQECSGLKERENQLKEELIEFENSGQKVGLELTNVRNRLNEFQQENSQLTARNDEAVQLNCELEVSNNLLVQEIEQLKEKLTKIEQERDYLLGAHEAMAVDLGEMQHKYESVQSLMEDTKKECSNEIEKLQAQLGNVNKDMTAMKSSLYSLEQDLNVTHEQKANLAQQLQQEGCRHGGQCVGVAEQTFKSQKDIKNQQVATSSHIGHLRMHEALESENFENHGTVPDSSGFFQVETLTDADVAHETQIQDLLAELESVRSDSQLEKNQHNQQIQELRSKVKHLEEMVESENQNQVSSLEVEDMVKSQVLEALKSAVSSEGSVIEDADVEKEFTQEISHMFRVQLDEELQRRFSGKEYELEEKYAYTARNKEAEIADKFDKEFKKYKKDMEAHMKHKVETIRAEKDTAFMKAMQKVKEDADRCIRQEVERQRLKLLTERVTEGVNTTDADRVGSQIGEVVQKLHEENKELAEARDALLQQVAQSHLHQEHLQEELRLIRGDDDLPDDVCDVNVVCDEISGDLSSDVGGSGFIQENDAGNNRSKFSHYRSQSLMLDWELSPQASFDCGREGSDALEFVEHFDRQCSRPRCRLLRQKYRELYDAVIKQDSGSSSVVENDEGDEFSGFKPEDIMAVGTSNILPSPSNFPSSYNIESASIDQTQPCETFILTSEGNTPTADEFQPEPKFSEGIFHPEDTANIKQTAGEMQDSAKSEEEPVIENFEPKIEFKNDAACKSGFFPESDSLNFQDNFERKSQFVLKESFMEEKEKPKCKSKSAPLQEETTVLPGQDLHSVKNEFLPEEEIFDSDKCDKDSFVCDDVFEADSEVKTYREHESCHLTTDITQSNHPFVEERKHADLLDPVEILAQQLSQYDGPLPLENEGFQPEIEYPIKSNVANQQSSSLDIGEGFTLEEDVNEVAFEAGDGFKPEEADFSFGEAVDANVMPVTPTSELESALVREALRKAVETTFVATSFGKRKERFISDIPEKVSSGAKVHNAAKRSQSASSVEGFIAESDQTDGVDLLAKSTDDMAFGRATSAPPEERQNFQLLDPHIEKEHIVPDTTLSDKHNEKGIQHLQKDKKLLEDKIADLLKEKCVMFDKEQQLTHLLENEISSRQQLEQKLADNEVNSENIETVKEMQKRIENNNKVINKLEKEIESLRGKAGFESKCESLKVEITRKEEMLMLCGKEYEALEEKMKELETALSAEKAKAATEKVTLGQEVTELNQRIEALSAVLDQDEGKLDLDRQVDCLETQVKELVSDKRQLQHKCKELEEMLRETQIVAMREKTELDKELESIEGQSLILTSANTDLQAKCVQLSNQEKDLVKQKSLLLDEKFSLECRLQEVINDNSNLQATCHDLQEVVQRSKVASDTLETQVKMLEGDLCDLTAAKQELHLQYMELENKLNALEAVGHGDKSCGEHRITSGINRGTSEEENGVEMADQGHDIKISELEKQLEEKEHYISKLEDDLDQIVSSEKRKKYDQMISNLENIVREKDNYIRKLEEHFLRQGPNQPFLIPTSGPVMVPMGTDTQETSSSGDSVGPPMVIDSIVEEGNNHSVMANFGDVHPEHPGDVETHIEDLADHSLVSVGDQSVVSISQISDVSSTSVTEVIPLNRPIDSVHTTSQGPKLVSAIQHSSPFPSPRAPSTSSYTGSFNSVDRIKAGFTPEEDSNNVLELKHFELVDEIARLRKDLSETKAIYTQENVLLKEALDREGSSRDNKEGSSRDSGTKGTLSLNSASFESDNTVEVTRLRQKVDALEETNKVLQIENERWLHRIQDQERVVMELRELLGRDVQNSDETDKIYGKQILLLQNERDHLLEKIRDFEMKNQKLTRKLGDNSILEESLRREKDLLYVKLHEKEDLEKELSEKRLALEKQKHSQEQLEEILYHKNVTEKELMRQKRLLEEELSEIECKLREKEELLEKQKNTLLRDIKRRGSSPPKLLAGSFSVKLSDDGSPATSTFFLETLPSTSTPIKQDEAASTPRELGRLELQLQEAERHHATAIQNLKESLSADVEEKQRGGRQRYQELMSSVRTEHFHQVPE